VKRSLFVTVMLANETADYMYTFTAWQMRDGDMPGRLDLNGQSMYDADSQIMAFASLREAANTALKYEIQSIVRDIKPTRAVVTMTTGGTEGASYTWECWKDETRYVITIGSSAPFGGSFRTCAAAIKNVLEKSIPAALERNGVK
jgi:hypothetical protein